jgi:HSP20 family molecular chaperone IbpA
MKNYYTLPQLCDLLLNGIEDANRQGMAGFEKKHSYPKANLYMSEDFSNYILECAVPGLAEKDLTVEVGGEQDGSNYICISGEKQENRLNSPYLQELKRSGFKRYFYFAREAINKDSIKSTLKDGVLTLTIENLAKKRSEKKKVKILEIKNE